jgi:anti-sigma28 factor (negative regulator of flagellin synthesis)
MPGLERLNNLQISDFNRVAESSQALKLTSDGTVIAKSSFANKLLSLIKPEKTRKDNQQTTATFVASITRTLNQGTNSGIFSRLGGVAPEQKEAIIAKLLNYKDASGKGILDDQLTGAKPLTGRKVSQVLQFVKQEAGKLATEAELNVIKNEIDEQVSIANDLLPQADRLRFGKLKLSENAKEIEGSIASVIKDIAGNLDKLQREVGNLTKQLKQTEAGPEADALNEKITELKEYIKSGDLSINDLDPKFNRRGIKPDRNEDTHVLASSIGYLSKKEPVPDAIPKKSGLHHGVRVDKGESRTYFEESKSERLSFDDHTDIGTVPGSRNELERDARIGEHVPHQSEKSIEAELRSALKDAPADEVEDLAKQAKFKSDEVEDLDPNEINAEKEAIKNKIDQGNAIYGIKTDKANKSE